MRIDPTADQVVADMERIFKPLAGRALVTAFHHDDRSESARVGRGWRRVTLAAPAAVLLVGAALAIGYGRADIPAANIAERSVAASTPATLVQPTALPSSVPVSAPSTAMPPPSTNVSAAVTRLAIQPRPATGSAPSLDALTRPSEPAPKPRPAEAAKLPAPAVALAADPRPAKAITVASAPSRRERAESSRAAQRCEPGSMEDRCIYEDVLRADARLRRSYDEAKRGGVSKLWLAAVSRRWKRAAKAEEDDPDGTIDQYGRLADALDQKRRETAR